MAVWSMPIKNQFSQHFSVKWSCCVFRSIYYSSKRCSEKPLEGSDKEETFSKHAYKDMCPWTSLQQFSAHLRKHVIYNEDGLVVLNKPYGVEVTPYESSLSVRHIVETLNTVSSGISTYSLTDVLPHLSKSLGYENLSIVKSTQRYSSGIAVLSASKAVTEKVQKSVLHAKSHKKLTSCYWAVVTGIPKPVALVERTGITLLTDSAGRSKQPVIKLHYSKSSLKRSEVKPVFVDYRVLSKNEQEMACLIKIRSSSTKWHFLRVYLAHRLSPILGDNLHGSRMKNIFGVPLAISPFSDAAHLPQKLNCELLQLLNLNRGQELLIPTHLHLHELTLISYRGKNEDLTFIAPPATSFVWTCEQLGLM